MYLMYLIEVHFEVHSEEKWGTINMYPMYPIGVHSGVQSGVDLKS